MMTLKYDEIIKLAIEGKTQETIIDKYRDMHYEEYVLLEDEEKVIYINELMAKGYSLIYICECLFGVSDRVITKELEDLGYIRLWHFYRAK
jgi:hypothetical protein